MISRRSFFAGVGALLAAPVIIKASSLMPIRGIIVPTRPERYVVTAVRLSGFQLWPEIPDSRFRDGIKMCGSSCPYAIGDVVRLTPAPAGYTGFSIHRA